LRRKNFRFVAGMPLFMHTVRAAQESGVHCRLIVSSDDPDVRRWAVAEGIEFLERPPELAGDQVTIAEVAKAVADLLDWRSAVMVLQPTSPLRSSASIAEAQRRFADAEVDSLATVAREPHLYWFSTAGNPEAAEPLFAERVNRQYAKQGVFRETGAIQIVTATWLRSSTSMVGQRHLLFELPAEESIDIDTYDDFDAAARRLESSRVVLRMTANRGVGSGHLFHCLLLAEELPQHDIVFLLRDCDDFVARTLEDRGFPYVVESDLAKDLYLLRDSAPRALIVNDVLDTTEEELVLERQAGFSVVSIEDLGAGLKLADWVVNALYPGTPADPSHVVSGPRWATLRWEFRGHRPRPVRAIPERILLAFGGTDPGGFAQRLSSALSGKVDAEIVVVLGPGSPDIDPAQGVVVKRDVRSMAEEMADADVIVTAAGRTVFEAAAIGTPVVVVAQSAREATHSHTGFESGVIFMGVGALLDDDHLVAVVKRLLENYELRSELRARLKASIDGRGAERIAHHLNALLRGL
jgi:CMP-N-acetylneuraminic acid synthetase/spore coat polysaccharide biosynthesis predicted glycosyltransferase SpsG